ncbi:transposase [Lysinibacillus fusiformis]|mgnify:CR=1 FL=1|uniref:transposase n=1 Tax=Lysinibacillus fusiformis TaxID=28031 RepID=UPI0020BF4CB3|nr:transposase [Lysinibacillus fusiformis]WRS96253.1 transposase [Lysinibacillus fusiformis]
MNVFIIVTIIVIPALMVYLQQKSDKMRLVFNALGVVSAILFGYIAATSITQIILEDVVFMTTIHAVFLNPIFLLTGAYLGLFFIQYMIDITIHFRAKR